MAFDKTFLVFLACYARLQELEMKRYGIENEGQENKGRFRPLEGAEHEEYAGLKLWWNDIGNDSQFKLRTFARGCGKDISNQATVQEAARVAAKDSMLILPSTFKGS